jgi:NADH:ubiquinone oxidoreductase subunit K
VFVIAGAAAEAAVGLAIVVSLFRARTGTEIDDLSTLRD